VVPEHVAAHDDQACLGGRHVMGHRFEGGEYLPREDQNGNRAHHRRYRLDNPRYETVVEGLQESDRQEESGDEEAESQVHPPDASVCIVWDQHAGEGGVIQPPILASHGLSMPQAANS